MSRSSESGTRRDPSVWPTRTSGPGKQISRLSLAVCSSRTSTIGTHRTKQRKAKTRRFLRTSAPFVPRKCSRTPAYTSPTCHLSCAVTTHPLSSASLGTSTTSTSCPCQASKRCWVPSVVSTRTLPTDTSSTPSRTFHCPWALENRRRPPCCLALIPQWFPTGWSLSSRRVWPTPLTTEWPPMLLCSWVLSATRVPRLPVRAR
mmetsp:Transcript_33818/g.77286  ORF Transcript_33818/g.77286 Transcript_33818/m.77286 type:complete len:203 (+) Transcript_33818:923-1531(+)